MPSLANIVINDGAATPAAKTFEPIAKDASGVSRFEERSGGIPLGNPTIAFSLKRPPQDGKVSSADRVYRGKWTITAPVLEVTSPSTGTGIQPAPTLSYVGRVNIEFVLPERSTLQNRKDLLAYAKNLLAATVATQTVAELSDFYG